MKRPHPILSSTCFVRKRNNGRYFFHSTFALTAITILPITSLKRFISTTVSIFQHKVSFQPSYQPIKHPCTDPGILASKLKFHDKSASGLKYLPINGVERTRVSYLHENTFVDEKIPESQINMLIDIIKDLNLAVLSEMESSPDARYEHIEMEVEILVRVLMSRKSSRKLLVEWVFAEEIFSPEVFRLDQIRRFFAQILLQCGLEHATFANWDRFGDSFQDLLIQALNCMSLSDAEAFCRGFLEQVSFPLKERTFNVILECFAFQYVPLGKLELGNSLLDEMVDAGLTPSSLAYENIIGFNVVTSFILNQSHEHTYRVRALYFQHRKNRKLFSMLNCHSLLCVFMTCSKHGAKESVALLEIIACLMNNGFVPTVRNCQEAFDAIKRLLDMYDPNWDHQLSPSATLDKRIMVMLKAHSCIKELATADIFSILLFCFYRMDECLREDHIVFASILFQALDESSLDEACFGSLLNFYYELDYLNGIQNAFNSMKAYNLVPDVGILRLALKYFAFKGPEGEAHVLYNSFSGPPTPEILSLMMVANAATHDLAIQSQLWDSCLESSMTLTSTCYSNAVLGLNKYIRKRSPQQIQAEHVDLHAHLHNILKSLDTTQPIGSLSFAYSLLIQTHAHLCYLFPSSEFQDFQLTYKKCLYGYKQKLLDSCYSSVFFAFKIFHDRTPALKLTLLLETKKVASIMCKNWPRLSCETFFRLLTLLKDLDDELLFLTFMSQFRYMLTKKRISDPESAQFIFDLEPKKLSVREQNFFTPQQDFSLSEIQHVNHNPISCPRKGSATHEQAQLTYQSENEAVYQPGNPGSFLQHIINA